MNWISIKNIVLTPEKKWKWGCLLHWSTKFYKNVFLFISLTTLGTLIEFWLPGSLSWVLIQPLIVIVRRGDFLYHHFIGHCHCLLIPVLISFEWNQFQVSFCSFVDIIGFERENIALEFDFLKKDDTFEIYFWRLI